MRDKNKAAPAAVAQPCAEPAAEPTAALQERLRFLALMQKNRIEDCVKRARRVAAAMRDVAARLDEAAEAADIARMVGGSTLYTPFADPTDLIREATAASRAQEMLAFLGAVGVECDVADHEDA